VGDEGGRLMYALAYRGLQVGGEIDALRLVSLEGVQSTPDVRSNDVDRARTHGQWAGVDLLGGRAVTATVQVVAALDDPVWAQLKTALTPTGVESPLLLQLPGFADGRIVQADVRVRRVSIPVDVERYQFGVPQAVVEWWATDPRFYDSELTELSVPVFGTQDNGAEFDIEFDLEFGGVVPRGVVTADNVGTFGAPWSVTFTGPVTNPRIENQLTGDTLEFTGTVPGGSSLTVGSLNRTVQLDGVSRYQWLDVRSQWFDLEPGSTQVRITAESGTGQATLTFRSTWI
jgi:hypothetical protein